MKNFYFLFKSISEKKLNCFKPISGKWFLTSLPLFLFLGMSSNTYAQQVETGNQKSAVQKTQVITDRNKNISPAINEKLLQKRADMKISGQQKNIQVQKNTKVETGKQLIKTKASKPGSLITKPNAQIVNDRTKIQEKQDFSKNTLKESNQQINNSKSGKALSLKNQTKAERAIKSELKAGEGISAKTEQATEKQLQTVQANTDQSPFESVKGKREDISKRDLYSKTYVNEDGSFTALVGAGPIHYQKNGQFLDIDTKVIQNPNAQFPYANTANLMESYFGATAHKGVKSKTTEGEVLEFLNAKMYWEVNGQAVNTQEAANTAPVIDNDKVTYPNIFGSISAEYQVLVTKRELNYIIPTKQALGDTPANADYLVFSEDILLPLGWTATTTDRGIVVKDNLGKEIYLYENPVSKDASSELGLSREQNTIFESIQIGQMLTIKTKVKTEWLLSSERVFPVKVDPTTNCFVDNNGVSTTGVVNSIGFITGLNDDLASGYGPQGIDNINGYAKYNISAIPIGSTISNAVSWTRVTSNNTYTGNGHAWASCFVDPQTASGAAIYQQGSSLYWNANPYQNTGNLSQTLNATARTDIQNALNQGWFAMLLYPIGPNWYYNEWMQVKGRTGGTTTGGSNQYRPYLSITYTSSSGCSGTPNAGEIAVGSHVDNPGQQYVVVAVGYSQGTGIEYRWQKRTSVNYGAWSGWSDVTAFNPTYAPYTATAPASGTREEWRLQVRCTNSNITANSTTDVFYASDCYQGDGFELNPEDGYGITSSSNFRVADDFIVPQYSSFSIRTITMDVFTAGTVTNATLNIRKHDGGVPGSVVATRTMAPTRIMYWGDFLGVIPWYRLSFDLATPINLGTGTYWLEPTVTASGGNTVYWATTYGTTGGVAGLSNDYGASWVPDYDNFYDMVFFVVGDCNSCDAVTASASNSTVCEGDTVTLSASSTGNYTYHWYIGWSEQNQTFDEDLGTGQTKTVTVNDSEAYWVIATNNTTGCRDYDYVLINVTPAPSLIVLNPIEAIACSDETAQISLVGGGVIPETILEEKWDPLSNPWIINTVTYGGAGPEYARWGLAEDNYRGIRSPDLSLFAIVDSNAYGAYEMESSLISPPLSLIDYNSPSTNITLTFNHYYRRNLSSEQVAVEYSTDGVNWNNLRSFTSNQGTATIFKAESIDLNAYKGVSFFQIRFRYHANNGYYWAIDDVKITGTNPLSTTVTWEVKDSNPVSYAGLYTDAAGTIPYTGGHATTLYASPSVTTTYQASAKTSVGCPAETSVTVERGDKNWISTTNTQWNNAANWNEGGIPTADHCVKIPGTLSFVPTVTTDNAQAKNITIYNGGSLKINSGGALTVQEGIDNQNTTADNITIESDGNLIQVDDNAVNTGLATVRKAFTFSQPINGERKQYNFISVPVVDNNKYIKPDFYFDGINYIPAPSVQAYNESTYYFDEVNGKYISGKGYAVKEAPEPAPATGTGEFKGELFNGVLNYPITKNGGGYNLVGNPYPSNLDIKKLYDDNSSKIESTIYFWDNRTNTEYTQQGSDYDDSQYAFFNATSGTDGTGVAAPALQNGPNARIPTRDVKVGTGFMVEAQSNTTLSFKNAYRTKDGDVGFFGKTMDEEATDDRYWLTMTAPSGIMVMNAVVYFEGGRDEFWIDDTESFDPSDDLYTIVDDKRLAIQGKRPFTITDQVPLGYRAYAPGYHFISVYQKEGVFEESRDIYLIDHLLNKTWNLSKEPYRFLTKSGQYNNRFTIVYKPQFTETGSFSRNEIEMVKQNNQIVITSSIDKLTGVEIFDLNSRSVYSASDINTNSFSVDALSFKNQIIVVSVKTEVGEVVNKKFVNK